ncbi:MAG: S58 family peptidase [Chloroflexi bacterium]|nr:S58 family peptidase [Chloroflexota bacterium]
MSERYRARELGIAIGELAPGALNALTDVEGVRVGHATVIAGDSIRTGVTAILPHGRNLFAEKVPGGLAVANGFGKLVGVTQLEELGEIESPIVLTGTLSTFRAADALLGYMLALPGNEEVRSLNPIVGETNDGWLSDGRRRPITKGHVVEAIRTASGGAVREGTVGAGTGTVCFGWKGGIGTSSRVVAVGGAAATVAVLAQTNFGGSLRVRGVPLGERLAAPARASGGAGSCMLVVATDAALDARQLRRLARRAIYALAAVGSHFAHGSGDYAIAFATRRGSPPADAGLSPLFAGVAEATEEAVLNSLFTATTVVGRDGHRAEAIPLERVVEICRSLPLVAARASAAGRAPARRRAARSPRRTGCGFAVTGAASSHGRATSGVRRGVSDAPSLRHHAPCRTPVGGNSSNRGRGRGAPRAARRRGQP